MDIPILPSSDKVKGNFPKSKIDLDYFKLDIGQSFSLPTNSYNIHSIRTHAKRFINKNPTINLKVINHGDIIEVARIPLIEAQNDKI